MEADCSSRHGGSVATLLRIVGYITLPIELLRKGDWILSRDENDPDGPLVAAQITEKYERVADHLQVVGIVDDLVRGQTLFTTDEHPFYVPGRAWTHAERLDEADPLVGPSDVGSAVVTNRRESHLEGVKVYNMEVGGSHTYFVLAEGSEAEPVWVHNAGNGYRALSPEDAQALQAGERITPKGTALGRQAMLDHVRGDTDTGYLSLSKTRSGTIKYDSGNGVVEIDLEIAKATGSTVVAHENLLQVVQRIGRGVDVDNVIEAKEFLIKGGIHPDAVIPVR